ncbi:hypothetical protein TSUD_158900 [Trifolium subterraneum]|uniref:RNase H type-1 domain-containing protein n=1 Tax=Trifolium subterraneum TaxID=3900 RepID=A0A2Z6P6S9_TRISU|nr:hypothetical protein TSUD_158900 [Trifolium subterraneum]
MDICQKEDKEVAGRFAMLIWVIWNNRNSGVWSNAKEPGQCLGVKAKHLWMEWHAVQQHQLNTTWAEQQHQQLQWKKPPIGWYKCNVNAGFHGELNKTSASWCLRDHTRRFMMA